MSEELALKHWAAPWGWSLDLPDLPAILGKAIPILFQFSKAKIMLLLIFPLFRFWMH